MDRFPDTVPVATPLATPDTAVDLSALELRVVDGPQRQARAPLPRGIACVLAADSDRQAVANILLREDRLPPAAVRITAQDEAALVEVLHGEVGLGGQVHAAGAIAPWARHQRLHIGSAVVAFGRACEDHWPLFDQPVAGGCVAGSTEDAGEDKAGAGTAAIPGTAAAATATASSTSWKSRGAWYRRAEAWLVGTGALVLLMCAAALQVTAGTANAGVRAPAAGAPGPEGPAQALAESLAAAGFAGLRVESGADGVPRIVGRLATDAQRTRLAAWVAAQPRALALDVRVDEALAREVAEVFRIQGVPVRATAIGPGRVQVQAQEADAARLARALEAARRDVRGLDALELANQPPPAPKPAPPVVDDPGKRIAALVPGEMAHVVTADGSRYFVGAQLPSGHRITQIDAQALLVERDGEISILSF